jgi:hypothetical protein
VDSPVRGETVAFYITVASAVLMGSCLALGAMLGETAGLALFAAALIVAGIRGLAARGAARSFSLSGTGAEAEDAPTRRRILVVANRTLDGEELRALLRQRADDGTKFRVVAPILASRIHYLTSDIDEESEEAQRRLLTLLAWALGEGLDASGKVGDPHAALGAIEDELRLFGPDEVIVSTYPPGRSNWLERGILERLRAQLDIPVTHVTVEAARAGAAPVEYPRAAVGASL